MNKVFQKDPDGRASRPTILRMLHFETPCQGPAVYHSQPAFAKSTALFSQRTQCMPVSTTTPCLTVSAFNGKRGTKSLGRGSWRCKNQAHLLPRSQLGRIHVRACVEVRRTPKTRGRSCVVREACSCEGAWFPSPRQPRKPSPQSMPTVEATGAPATT